MFYINFNKRYCVSTNRSSVPCFPTLYLGDSTYVCWKELNEYRLRDLFFVGLENKGDLTVIPIQKIEDFFIEIEENNSDDFIYPLLRYFITFPLVLACTIKVNHPNGNFKPEYIIPQLLLDYT